MVSDLNFQGNLPKTDFLTSWLRQQSVKSMPKQGQVSPVVCIHRQADSTAPQPALNNGLHSEAEQGFAVPTRMLGQDVEKDHN